jgi:hypothetical protein
MHTDIVSHAGTPTFFALALFAILEKVDRMLEGAHRVPGLACAALIRAFNGSDNFDMLSCYDGDCSRLIFLSR